MQEHDGTAWPLGSHDRHRSRDAPSAERELSIAAARAALDHLPLALLLLDRGLTVLLRNAAAARLSARGALPHAEPSEPFRLPHQQDTARLAGLVPVVAAGGPPATLRAAGAETGADLCCFLRPLAPDAEGAVLLAIRPRHAPPAIGPEDLAGLFGLTPTEAGIALSLAAGKAPRDIAAARGRSLATVRSQIRTVLRKTECATVLDIATLLTRLGS